MVLVQPHSTRRERKSGRAFLDPAAELARFWVNRQDWDAADTNFLRAGGRQESY